VIFGVRVDPRHHDVIRVIAILTGLKAPALDATLEANPSLDVVNPFAPYPRSR
jgi:cell division GTPase FtsZ